MTSAQTVTQTARLLIRQLTAADIGPLAQLWSDADVTRFMGGARDPDKVTTSLRGVLAAPKPSRCDLWPTIERNSGKLVGHCGLIAKHVDGREEVELVYVLAADAWGKGYATEAAVAIRDHASNTLGLKRLIALIDPDHAASAHVARKAGMIFETETRRPSGKTLHVYAMTL